MPCMKLKQFLDRREVHYQLISHPATYTAQLTAASSHVAPDLLAKTVMIVADGKFAMAVVPAPRRVDLTALHTGIGAQTMRLASELEFKEKFPDCDAGAMPPFGNLYGMEVYVDEAVAAQKEIAFNAGTHTETLRMSCADFMRLVDPKVLKIAVKGAAYASSRYTEDRPW
jgi:Ala-tRNA(Pro) deacylase